MRLKIIFLWEEYASFNASTRKNPILAKLGLRKIEIRNKKSNFWPHPRLEFVTTLISHYS